MASSGIYIVIEGPDGTGKTTQAKKLAEFIGDNKRVAHYVHEPGHTAIGNELEMIIKNRQLARKPLTDLLLFTANRVEVFHQVISPALADGHAIIADRNWLSSIAYQGVASQLGVDTVLAVTKEHLPMEYIEPTFTIILEAPAAHRQKLLDARSSSHNDYFETQSADFQLALHDGYQQARRHTNPRATAVVSAEGSIDDVFARIITALTEAAVLAR